MIKMLMLKNGMIFWGKSIIEVVSPKESHITTITDSQEIKIFVDKLKIDKWKLEELPADTNKASEYVMYQKDTIHFGETSKNNTELNESAHIVTDRKSTRLNSSHVSTSYAVFCLKKKIPTYTKHDKN